MSPKKNPSGEKKSRSDYYSEFVSAANKLDVPLLILDTKGIIQHVNQSFLTIIGIDEDLILSRSIFDVAESTNPNSPIIEEFGHAIKNESCCEEITLFFFVREPRIIKFMMKPISRGRNVIGISCVGLDISRELRVEPESDLSSFYYNLLNQMPVGVIMTDFEDKIIIANPSVLKILGRSEKEVIGHSFVDFVLEEDRPLAIEQTRRRSEGICSVYVVRILNDAGELRHLRINAVPYKSKLGERKYALGIIRDVTDEIMAAQKIREETEKLHTIAKASFDVIIILDQDRKIVFLSDSAKWILGPNFMDYMGMDLIEVLAQYPRAPFIKKHIDKLLEQGDDAEFHQSTRFFTPSGEWRYVDISAGVTTAGSERYIVAVIRDVTETKKIQRIQAQQHRELQLYASILRHDLRNDIGLVLSNIDLIRMMNEEWNLDELREIVDSIDSVCARVLFIVNAFGSPVEKESTNITEVIKEIVEQSMTKYPSLTINLDIMDKNLVVAGSSLLPMVVENLLRNTVKYAGEDAVVDISVTQMDQNAVITVSDNGPGIDESVKDMLFTRGATTSGTGLGLYLSREIIKTLGGDIVLLESEPGHGATFQITLPLL